MITQHELKENLDYDPGDGIFRWRNSGYGKFAGQAAGTVTVNGYRIIGIGQGKYYAHRLAWLYVHGEFPEKIDHINHDRQDNRIENLRSVNVRANAMNAALRKDNTSGHVGVEWLEANKKWRARVCLHGKTKHLGLFDTKEKAVNARVSASKRYGFHENHGSVAN